MNDASCRAKRMTWVAATCLVMGAGCGDDASRPRPDAGEEPDSGMKLDSGTKPESGMEMDAARPQCAPAQERCEGRCRDLAVDRAHCGSCGHACSAGEVCNEGTCELSCSTGLTDCEGSCRDLMTDRAHCGACGVACEPGEVCSGGTCGLSCGGATPTQCGNACVDTGTNRVHCGGCAAAPGSDGDGADAGPDADGGVGHDAGVPDAGSIQRGVTCDMGEVCEGGACVLSCPPGMLECDGRCIDPDTNAMFCGATASCQGGNSGMDCSTPTDVAEAGCLEGECIVSECAEGTDDCDGDGSNGCETSVASDPANCGACGISCADDAPYCLQGMCRPAPPSCREVNGRLWCRAPAEGVACNETCGELGLTPLADSTAWLDAQDELSECEAIATAFGNTVAPSIGAYSYACVERRAVDDQFLCSTHALCPDELRTTTDSSGHTAFCPCD